jgi:hypothetical protein
MGQQQSSQESLNEVAKEFNLSQEDVAEIQSWQEVLGREVS